MAAEMAYEIVESELLIPLVKEFFEWDVCLEIFFENSIQARNNAIDNYEWDQENP
ncbi:hypothetical protein PHYBLDRAFT_148616 [Phycomyces blakesleeanus NRRL 1555(-)]|uniref:Uncharacterized protein n=1 Tax=Phycomyces blakesleeanus (strain ATCC 8743b / DSM 1359 / FGSC 10004 / NBRC 33097 / NRRL 1555) TaxID=763407 RepID=A0A167LLG5_PHYB8|nr:hypothetical protein PHYBLDRAFT_148616 [Phycomyces blakesleeanus NRRL 1555(-)]OAD70704.1 hypothetical protein PHYBLDRAFT_148616 [Phycomyces blakesleeanus NRRL 1555(-)]|eukprot:XP_018288744.1 hypothetical protein PHYBLDRAFT_148616 [Phycomyces blakesleeanus NRRL 1555(-)]